MGYKVRIADTAKANLDEIIYFMQSVIMQNRYKTQQYYFSSRS